MGHIDSVVERIPGMSRKERLEWRGKALAQLKRSPGNSDAVRLLAALDLADETASSASLVSTGLLEWEKHDAGESSFRAYYNGQCVGKIFKRNNHSNADKEVYSVEIRGEVVADGVHRIANARRSGEEAFRQKHANGETP